MEPYSILEAVRTAVSLCSTLYVLFRSFNNAENEITHFVENLETFQEPIQNYAEEIALPGAMPSGLEIFAQETLMRVLQTCSLDLSNMVKAVKGCKPTTLSRLRN